MISTKQFDDRVKALWHSQQSMASAIYWKSGKRKGQLRTPARPLYLTHDSLRTWLWKQVGLNAIPCPFCHVPIDILSLTIDHQIPRDAGGEFRFENMECCCRDCNERKGEMTRDAFVKIIAFKPTLSPYDQAVFWNRLKAAHGGSARRFWRDKQKDEDAPAAKVVPVKQERLEYLGSF